MASHACAGRIEIESQIPCEITTSENCCLELDMTHAADVVAGTSALGGALGWTYGASVASWAFSMLPITNSTTFIGVGAVVAGPWVGAAIGAGLGVY